MTSRNTKKDIYNGIRLWFIVTILGLLLFALRCIIRAMEVFEMMINYDGEHLYDFNPVRLPPPAKKKEEKRIIELHPELLYKYKGPHYVPGIITPKMILGRQIDIAKHRNNCKKAVCETCKEIAGY